MTLQMRLAIAALLVLPIKVFADGGAQGSTAQPLWNLNFIWAILN